jgi:hypothetical protein
MADKNEREHVFDGVTEARVLYCNSVQVAQTTFDLRFWFGLLTRADQERIVTKVENVIYMSPQHAKVFAAVLNKHVEKYESLYGTIPLPADFTEAPDTEPGPRLLGEGGTK